MRLLAVKCNARATHVWVYTSGCAMWSHPAWERHCHGDRAPMLALVIAVVEDNPADVYCSVRVLQAYGLPSVLQVLESRQCALHFLTSLPRRTMSGVPISSCWTSPPLGWTTESCCNGSKPCPCVGGYAWRDDQFRRSVR
jgi:hypothetical protein